MAGKVAKPVDGHQLGTPCISQAMGAAISWCPDKPGQCTRGAPKFSHLPLLQFRPIDHLYFSGSTAHNCLML